MIKHFAIEFNRCGLEWDSDYGIERRRGWSAFHEGSCVIEFVGSLKAVKRLLQARKEWKAIK